MKKILFLFIALVFIVLPIAASADIIPRNSHGVSYCAKIVNLDKYPSYYLLGFIKNLTGEDSFYKINANECLTKGYKFNTLSIYAAEKSYIDSVGLEGIKTRDDSNLIPSSIAVEAYGGYADNSDPLDGQEVEYSIASIAKKELFLYKSKQILSYNNGVPDKVETFQFGDDDKNVPASKVGFFQMLWDFLLGFLKK